MAITMNALLLNIDKCPKDKVEWKRSDILEYHLHNVQTVQNSTELVRNTYFKNCKTNKDVITIKVRIIFIYSGEKQNYDVKGP